MSSIARRLGVSRSTIYKYVPDLRRALSTPGSAAPTSAPVDSPCAVG